MKLELYNINLSLPLLYNMWGEKKSYKNDWKTKYDIREKMFQAHYQIQRNQNIANLFKHINLKNNSLASTKNSVLKKKKKSQKIL